MNHSEELDLKDAKLKQIQLFIYLIPIVGLIPAIWTLLRDESDTSSQKVSRLSVKLAIAWLIAYALLWLGSTQTTDIVSFRLLYLNALLTSGYFLSSFLIMFNIWRNKPPR
ncbi:MAG: hypothetical protein EA365_13825 [Gloeocapsa sp. DLM2.Bin57]|nr:MAG: hypothetical protein EA365_13825 [Gloeocapsa sp. DLM2.Bin57]